MSPVNDAPDAINDTAHAISNVPTRITVLGNDHDIEGDLLVVTSATSANGVVTINPDGSLSFTPAPGYVGPAIITYTISDGHGGTATADVRVDVGPQAFVGLPPSPDSTVTTPARPFETIVVEGLVMDTVADLGGAPSITPLAVEGVVLSTVNRAGNLNGLGTLGGRNGLVHGEVIRIDRLHNLDSILTERRGLGTYDVQGLTGFSLRFSLSNNSGLVGSRGQLILETLVRENYLIVQISNSFALVGKRAVEYRVMQADGRPLPDWLDYTGQGVLIGRHPVDIDNVRLRVTAILSDGSSVSREVEIQTMSGEIQSLVPGKRSELPRFFTEQLRTQGMLNPAQVTSLADAIAG